MQSYGVPSVRYDWWAGNSLVANESGTFISAHAAHAAHAGLIMSWAGSFTVYELSRFNAELPMGEPGLILLPNLARLGLGVTEGGLITQPEPIIAIVAFHLVSAAVLAAGAMWHLLRAPTDLSTATGGAKRFNFDGDDPANLGVILGHHLIFLGLGAIAFVELAKRVGIVDIPPVTMTLLCTLCESFSPMWIWQRSGAIRPASLPSPAWKM
jgi:chlorophyll a/b binding light-harvesting protein PcbD